MFIPLLVDGYLGWAIVNNAPRKKSYDQPRQLIKKQRHYFANKGPTKVRLVKVVVFPLIMYGCESWIIKKGDHRRIDAFELWC